MCIEKLFSSLRRHGRFLAIALLLAASVPASFTINIDGAAMAQRSTGGTGNRGGGDGPNGTDNGRECYGGRCSVREDCVGRQCGQTTTTYLTTPAGCQVKICQPFGATKMKCTTNKAADEKLCTRKRA